MLLTTAAGTAAAVIGVVTGLLIPSSRVAKAAGWTAVGLGVGPTLLFIPMTFGGLFPIAYAITAWPAVLGAVAITLSKRPRLHRERTFVAVTALVLVGLIGSAATIAAVLVHRSAAGEERLRGLLAGRPGSPLAGFEIEYQQRAVRCTDPAVVRYFEDRLAGAVNTTNGGGTTYHVTLRFADGHAASVPTGWSADGVTLSIGRRAQSEGWPTYRVDFPSPMPDSFRRMLDFLDAPYQQVAGQVFEITPDAISTGYNPSLDLRAIR